MSIETDDIQQPEGQIAPQVEGEAQAATTDEQQEQQRPLSAREAALEQIYANRRAELETVEGIEADPAQAGEGGGTGTDGEGDGGAPPAPSEAEPAPAGAAAPEGASAQPGADEPMVDLIVNGVVQRVTQAEAIRRAQIASAGSVALRQLAEEKRAREAAEAELSRLRAGQQTAPAGPTAPSPQPDDNDDDLDRIVQAVRYGSDQEARDALKVIRRSSRVPGEPVQPVDQNAIIERAASKVRADLDFDQAMEQVGRDYATVFRDTDLATLAAARVQAIVADDAGKGIHRAPYEVLREACQSVDAKFVRRDPPANSAGDARPTASAQPPSNGAAVQIDKGAREDAKRRLVAGPAAPLARQGVPSSEAPPMSETDIRRQGLEDIRRARGQSR